MENYGGPKGSEKGDAISSLLQNSDPRVQDRLELMDWPKGGGSLAKRGPERGGWHERAERPGPSDWVGVMTGEGWGVRILPR